MQEVETRVLPGPPAAYLELWEPFCPGWPSRREDGRESSQRQSSPPLGLLPLSSGCQPGAQRALGGNYCPSWVPELPGFHCGSRSAQVASPTGKMAGSPSPSREDGRESSQRQRSPPLGLLPLGSGCQPGAQRALSGNCCPSWAPSLLDFTVGAVLPRLALWQGRWQIRTPEEVHL
ncbi:uncharacterized protein LOC128579828 isoform X3 [Nycticebus coucang]|uniref:uncharacterized protein LOC128579828 isoform X3 n=1 Tax=Nycticebus coucang TaxID=9470 RepID=UPI00234C0FC6|nr:uncharacterized protein LOC128579828 isoform X3 [Nycticebus coucang]XP_053437989.1 uncharacterized protein LOC128579828 isoform X3 [Nycticebus coucang]